MTKIKALPKNWTMQEDFCLKEMIETKLYSLSEIAKKMGLSYVVCRHRQQILNIKNNFIKRLYSHDKDFWKNPNPTNTYWGGFGSADGCILPKHQGIAYQLQIQELDEAHLKKFILDCGFTGRIYRTRRINKSGLISNLVKVSINSPEWKDDLKNNFNLIPNKTKRLAPPNITNKYLLFCWLKGYIDGDGSISLNKCNNQLNISFASASKEIIYWITNFLDTEFKHGIRKTNRKVRHGPNDAFFTTAFSGLKAFVIFDFLSQIPTQKLERKWDKPEVLSLLEKHKQTHPELFAPNAQKLKDLQNFP